MWQSNEDLKVYFGFIESYLNKGISEISDFSFILYRWSNNFSNQIYK